MPWVKMTGCRWGVAFAVSVVVTTLVLVRVVPREHTFADVAMDFVEIGTSNFNTLIQQAPTSAVGLSVEPMLLYQNSLRNHPGVVKVNAAVTNNLESDTIDFYYVHPTDIRKHRLPAWLSGCNSAYRPHPEAVKVLQRHNQSELMRVDRVPSTTYGDLLKTYRVGSIGYLKLDVEGGELVILQAVIDACVKNPQLWPRVVQFEHKHVEKTELDVLLQALSRHGYTVSLSY